GFLAQTQHPELYGITNPINVTGIGAGTQRLLTLKVLDTGKSVQDSAEERHPPDKMLPVDQFLASLPQAQREKIETDIATEVGLRQQYRGAQPPAPVGAPKPPSQ